MLQPLGSRGDRALAPPAPIACSASAADRATFVARLTQGDPGGESSLDTWLRRIAVSRALMTIRSRRRQPALLPAEGDEVVTLRRDDNLPIAETADRLGVSLYALKIRVLRARHVLKDALCPTLASRAAGHVSRNATTSKER